MNKKAISFAHFVSVTLLGLSIYLKSPSVACVVVVALAIKEAKEFYETRQKSIEIATLERKVEELESKVKSFQNDVNRVVVRQAQYFGE